MSSFQWKQWTKPLTLSLIKHVSPNMEEDRIRIVVVTSVCFHPFGLSSEQVVWWSDTVTSALTNHNFDCNEAFQRQLPHNSCFLLFSFTFPSVFLWGNKRGDKNCLIDTWETRSLGVNNPKQCVRVYVCMCVYTHIHNQTIYYQFILLSIITPFQNYH